MRLSEKIQNGSTSTFLNSLNEAQKLKEERKYRNPESDPKAEDNFIHTEYRYKEPDWKSFVKEMAKDYWDAGQSFSSDDIDEFKDIMKESNFNLSDEELEAAWNYYWECYNEYLDEYNNVKESEETNVNEAEEGASIFELKFDCSNEEIFGIGEDLIDPIANTLKNVIEKIEVGKLDGPIMDVNGNKIGSFGIGYEGVQSGLDEECDTKLEEKYVESFGGDTKDFINEVEAIKTKLEEIDTDGFAAKLSQQMVWDWIEACDRLLEKANRLDSGDEFGTEE